MTTPTTVLLVDDHELIRSGLARAIERCPGLEVVGQAGDVAEALSAYRALQPQVVVTDLELPDGSGLDIVREVRRDRTDVGIVVLTLHTGDAQVFAAMEAGASAFLGKNSRGEQVAGAITHAARVPDSFLSSSLTGAVMRRSATAAARLTPREQDVLRLVADGLPTDEIGRRLYLGESTVKTHLNHIFRKLGVANRSQALAVAVRRGLLLEGLSATG